MKKRILVLLCVVALMVVMLAVSVGPAFAKVHSYVCTQPDTGASLGVLGADGKKFAKSLGYTDCEKVF
jgi:hypothetical protein